MLGTDLDYFDKEITLLREQFRLDKSAIELNSQNEGDMS